jgi:tetratricopeptide (TPR) repeat protein
VDEYRGNVRFLQEYGLASVERSLYLGMALVEDRADLDRGIVMLRSALAQTSKPPVEAEAALARALGAAGRPSEGAPYCAAALQANPRMSAVRAECAKLLELAGQKQKALEQYREALAADSELPAAAFGVAQLTRDFTEAVRWYRVAAESLPLRAGALNNLGNLLISKNETAEARRVLEESIALDPLSAATENNLARLSALGGDLPEAIQHVTRALQLDSDSHEARYNLAQLLYANGRANEAIAAYRDLLRRKPASVEGHLGLGNALADEGQLQEAIEEFRTVLRIRPNHREAAEHLKIALDLLSKK